MSVRVIIVMLSGAANSGKTTVGDMLQQKEGFQSFMFARPIKVMWEELQKLFPVLHKGMTLVTAADCEHESIKVKPISEDDERTNRFVLQRLGDVCKTAFDEEDVFSLRVVRHIKTAVARAVLKGEKELRVLITDNRLPAELAAIRSAVAMMDGVASSVVHRWLITSVAETTAPSLKDAATATHSSETLMKEMEADVTLVNSMVGMEDLWKDVQVSLDITLGTSLA